MKYSKLVRDKIPEIIRKNGKTAITHKAGETEFKLKLEEKLKEEIDEFFKSSSEELAKEELADVLEIIKNICELTLGIDMSELDKIRQKKEDKRGAFAKRIILDEVK